MKATILQNLIKVTTESTEKDEENQQSLVQELTRLYGNACQHLTTDGTENFIGDGPSRCVAEAILTDLSTQGP